MIITRLMRYVGGGIYSLASKSEDNPKKSNTIAVISSIATVLGVSDSVRLGLADTLVALADVLRAL